MLIRSRRALCVLLLVGMMAGCSASTTDSSPDVPQLRIDNVGPKSLLGLTVIFPESKRIEFGDVPAGETSEYRVVPGGVYRYAAYEYLVDGRLVTQPVVDWVGESPVAGSRFTYRLAVGSGDGPEVNLTEVVVDEP